MGGGRPDGRHEMLPSLGGGSTMWTRHLPCRLALGRHPKLGKQRMLVGACNGGHRGRWDRPGADGDSAGRPQAEAVFPRLP